MLNNESGTHEQNVRTRAYLLWETEGSPQGGAEHYWHKARERIEAESQLAYPPLASSTNRDYATSSS
jgi:hypothetical protein